MQNKFIETIIGGLVLIIALSFFFYAYNVADVSNKAGGYKISARFEQIDDVTIGTDVRIGGIKIGTVVNNKLDLQTYQAILYFNIEDEVKVPADSIAAIVSSGLLGRKYVSINPGAEDRMLSNGDEIIHTQSSVNLETLIGKFIFSQNSESL